MPLELTQEGSGCARPAFSPRRAAKLRTTRPDVHIDQVGAQALLPAPARFPWEVPGRALALTGPGNVFHPLFPPLAQTLARSVPSGPPAKPVRLSWYVAPGRNSSLL